MQDEYVILVDTRDREIGVMEKMEAHRKGFLHRAFSVFIFNDKGQMLLQQRAGVKYHSGGLWTNACCSHPRKDEETRAAAERRLIEEMGMNVPLRKLFSFIYMTPLDNELTEHEYDHVFIGFSNEDPVVNKDEVESFRWAFPDQVRSELTNGQPVYTEWFKICFDELMNHYHKINSQK